MADKRISGLPDGGAAQAGDIVPATRGARTFQVALAAPGAISYKGQYASSATYGLGDLVSDASSPPKFYISRVTINTGNALSSDAHWVEAAPGVVPGAGGLENATEIFNADWTTARATPVVVAPAVAIPAGRVWYVNSGRYDTSSVIFEASAEWYPMLTDDILALPAYTTGEATAANSIAATSTVDFLRNAANNLLAATDGTSAQGAHPLRIRQG